MCPILGCHTTTPFEGGAGTWFDGSYPKIYNITYIMTELLQPEDTSQIWVGCGLTKTKQIFFLSTLAEFDIGVRERLAHTWLRNPSDGALFFKGWSN